MCDCASDHCGWDEALIGVLFIVSRLRMLWMAERLEEEGERMLQEIEDDREDIDALFAELDANLEESRKVECD